MPAKKFVLRIDETLFNAIEKWANDEFRSVNGQIEWIISEKLKDAGRHPKSIKEKKEEKNINSSEPK